MIIRSFSFTNRDSWTLRDTYFRVYYYVVNKQKEWKKSPQVSNCPLHIIKQLWLVISTWLSYPPCDKAVKPNEKKEPDMTSNRTKPSNPLPLRKIIDIRAVDIQAEKLGDNTMTIQEQNQALLMLDAKTLRYGKEQAGFYLHPEVTLAECQVQIENYNRFREEFNCEVYTGQRLKCWHAVLFQHCGYAGREAECDDLPCRDHTAMFKVKGTGEFLYVSQPYDFSERELAAFCQSHGLAYQVLPYAWYTPGEGFAYVLSRPQPLT
jgi:hypothetical protein